MTMITLYEHPFAPVAPQVFEVSSLGEWLIAHYGQQPSVTVQVFAGEPCAESEITGNVEAILANDRDGYVVLQSPGLPAAWIPYAIALFAAVATALLMPKPELPSNVNRTQESPNNALGNRENKVRMLERVEDIYGTVRAIPSLMMPTYNKYIAHQKYEYGYYCVGRGYYDIDDVRDGDTLVSDIAGASAAIYDPFTSPNSGDDPVQQIGGDIVDPVLTVARSIEVDGITLKAPNEAQTDAASQPYTYTPDAGGDIITQGVRAPNFLSVAQPGDTVEVEMDDFNETSDDGIDYDGSLVNETFVSGPYNYSGTYVIESVSDGQIVLTTSTFAVAKEVDSVVTLDGVSGWTDWITLPADDRTEVWINVLAQQGIYKDDGSGKLPETVEFEIEIERLNADLVPTGVVEIVTGSLSGSVSDERADTIEHTTAWAGPARVRMRRTSDHDFDFEGTVIDEIKWVDLYSVSPVDRLDFGNKTTVHTVTQATPRATAVKARQLNCLASRLLPTFNGTVFSGAFDADGALASGTINATSKLVDIIAAVAVDPKIGARDLATDIDIAQIWGVQQQLDAWNGQVGQFNYTFDSDGMSFEETVITVANAGFCIAYRQNGKIRLALDQAQSSSTALFTHRNKRPNSESITRRFANDADYDGVEFVYVDPDTERSETITLPLDGNYTKLKKFEIAGIRSFTQAWLRANREYRKLLGQRISIETETTLDGRALLPNSRVDIVDNTRFKSYDGEVIGQAGLVLTLSQKVQFTPGQRHSIVLMRRDGSLQSIRCTPGTAANKVVLTAPPSEAIQTGYGVSGIRTIYSFAADSARGAQAYLVQEIDISDGQYVKVRAINYSADYYVQDNAPIPAKASIIN